MNTLPENPFTPMRAATLPEEFFGRHQELDTLRRAIGLGHIAIQGSVGIGKSSLLERLRQIEEGFAQEENRRAITHVAVGNADVRTLDEAANLILKRMVTVDQRQTTTRLTFAKLIGIESATADTTSFFPPNRRLDVLEKLLLDAAVQDPSMLIVLAFDEADKCPVPLSRLFRSIVTFCDLNGLRNVRFAVAGVNPYFQKMVEDDAGISRFFTKVIHLTPMPPEEATELVQAKLEAFCKDHRTFASVSYSEDFVETVVRLSGGHPHLLQLLGFHAVERELADPDGFIDKRDLVGSMQTICFNDRKVVYDSMRHTLEVQGRLTSLQDLFMLASSLCPTVIPRKAALDRLGAESLEWFVNHNILIVGGPGEYRLVDEFLRVRLLFDDETESRSAAEHRLIYSQQQLYDGERWEGEDLQDYEEDNDEDAFDDTLDQDEEDSIPDLRLHLPGKPLTMHDPILVYVQARSETGEDTTLNPEFDEIAVLVFDQSEHIVSRATVPLENDIAISSTTWTDVAIVTVPAQPAGKYVIRPQMRVTEQGRRTRWFAGRDLFLDIAPSEASS